MADKRMLKAAGRRLEYQWIEGTKGSLTPLVLLHEGLGSLQLWKDFPAKLVAATGRSALVYSRYGYGWSEALEAPRGVEYMHQEALESLPEVLDQLGIERPILVGHSDGGSIALIHAGSGIRPVSALILMAPHVFVEDLTVRSIAEAKRVFQTSDLAKRLAAYHADPQASFWGWNDIWLLPAFKQWNIEEYLPSISCPVLAIQGRDDEYGTLAQLKAIEHGISGPCQRVVLADCRHSPHRDQEQATLDAMVGFLGQTVAAAERELEALNSLAP